MCARQGTHNIASISWKWSLTWKDNRGRDLAIKGASCQCPPLSCPLVPSLNPWVRHQGHCDLISSCLSSSAYPVLFPSLYCLEKYSTCLETVAHWGIHNFQFATVNWINCVQWQNSSLENLVNISQLPHTNASVIMVDQVGWKVVVFKRMRVKTHLKYCLFFMGWASDDLRINMSERVQECHKNVENATVYST